MPVDCGETVYIFDEPYRPGHAGNTRDWWVFASRFPFMVTEIPDDCFAGWIPSNVILQHHSLQDDDADAIIDEPDELDLWWNED